MRSLIFMAIGLPFAAADACLSVVAKTRLITSVVTTITTSTIPILDCTTKTGILSFTSAETSGVTSIIELPTTPSFASSPIAPISSISCADCSSIRTTETEDFSTPSAIPPTDLDRTSKESSASTTTGHGYDSTSSIQTLSTVTTLVLPTASEHTIGTLTFSNTSSYESVTSLASSAEHLTSDNFLTSTVALPSSSNTASETLSTQEPSSCEGESNSCSTSQPISATCDSTISTGTAQTEVSSTSCDSTVPGSSFTTTPSIWSSDSITTTDVVPSTSSCDTTESTKAATSTLLSTQASDTASQSHTLSKDIPSSTETSSQTNEETGSSSLSQVSTTQAATTTSAEIIASTTSSKTSTNSAPTETNLIRSYPADIVDELQDDSMVLLREYLERNPPNSGCTIENASVRREWGDLSRAQRQAYIDAVLCLQSEPSKSGSQVPGARSRFDDFVGTHILQTDWIHGTANFLSWHRYFIFEFEKALKTECGYEGAMPYWNWDRYAGDLASSPLFNGDDASISGGSVNGDCVASGPFKDMTVSLGPGNSVKYNPRCLVRELSNWWSDKTKADATYPLIAQSNNVGEFQDRLQSGDGVHAGGHFSVGGNPGGDIYASPGDPYFHLHHAMVDRVWWIWQMQNLESRLFEVQGYDRQARRDGTASDKVNLGVNGPSVEIGSLLDTMGGLNGELCYIYF